MIRFVLFLFMIGWLQSTLPAISYSTEGITFPVLGSLTPRHAREIQSSNWSVGAETMDRDYTIYKNWKEYLGPLGFKKARIQAGWAKTEPQAGVYQFAWLDEIICDMQEQGVEPWVCLCYGNSIYSEGGGTRLGASIPKTKESLEAWKRFVAMFVARYKDIIDEWEVWNEPNQGNSPTEYAHFLIETAETIRGIQPNAKILAMSTAGVKIEFVTGVLDIVSKVKKLSLIDQITYHPYTRNPDTSYTAVAKLREAIARYSSKIIIRQGENGAPSERRQTKALRNYDWTELSQAKWALRRLLGDLGRDIPSSYFAIMDMKYPDEMNRKGLLHSNEDQMVSHRKQSYVALQNLASVFDDTLIRNPHYPYSSSTEKSLSVFAYENRFSGMQTVTIWMDGEVPSDSNETSKVDFTMYQGKFDHPVYVDLREGTVYDIPQEKWSRKGSIYTFHDIPCYDSPILISCHSNITY